MKLSARDRQVLACAGAPAAEVAAALRLPVEAVRASRDRCGRNVEDGTPRGAPARPVHPASRLDFEDFDALMRSNRSVCG